MSRDRALPLPLALVAALPLWGLACDEAGIEARRGKVYFVRAAALLDGAPRSAREAERFFARTSPLAVVEPGQEPPALLAILSRPAGALQLGLRLVERTETGERVVHADQLDAEASDEVVSIVLPRSLRWPRPCRSYRATLSTPFGELARGSLGVGGCPRAVEAMRGAILFHLGRSGPTLFDFPGTLAEYRRRIGARRVLVAPRGQAVFVGWKAAFRAPVGAAWLTAVLRELATRRVVDRRELATDPSWDTLAGGWDVPPGAKWPRSGYRYRLTLRRGDEVVARGEFVLARR